MKNQTKQTVYRLEVFSGLTGGYREVGEYKSLEEAKQEEKRVRESHPLRTTRVSEVTRIYLPECCKTLWVTQPRAEDE